LGRDKRRRGGGVGFAFRGRADKIAGWCEIGSLTALFRTHRRLATAGLGLGRSGGTGKNGTTFLLRRFGLSFSIVCSFGAFSTGGCQKFGFRFVNLWKVSETQAQAIPGGMLGGANTWLGNTCLNRDLSQRNVLSDQNLARQTTGMLSPTNPRKWSGGSAGATPAAGRPRSRRGLALGWRGSAGPAVPATCASAPLRHS